MLLFVVIDYPQLGRDYVIDKNFEETNYNGKLHKKKIDVFS